MIRPLSSVGAAALGFKSLQNGFFYVNKATIDSYDIERQFLLPILMLKNIDSESFVQKLKPEIWLFNCKEKKTDLRGTGALRYIDAMANRAANDKKQTGKVQTMKEALEAQGGGLWYAPKASPHRRHIWLRKAFDTVYSPFLFDVAALVDQRCNSVEPVEGVTWQELAAAMTTTLFAYSLEINGSASLGAGALEAPTTKLRNYPILDVRELNAKSRQDLVGLAQNVWKTEMPTDWSVSKPTVGQALKDLDAFILSLLGRGVTIDRLYNDLGDACRSRILVAKDKDKKTKKASTENVGNVAESIAVSVRGRIQSRNFPDDFCELDPQNCQQFVVEGATVRQIRLTPLLNQVELHISDTTGAALFDQAIPRFEGELIARALLWGRSSFLVPKDELIAENALDSFLKWAGEIDAEIEIGIRESALGTGYEDLLKKEIYKRLGIHEFATTKLLPHEIIVT